MKKMTIAILIIILLNTYICNTPKMVNNHGEKIMTNCYCIEPRDRKGPWI